jgi:protein SCO1/2
MGLLTQARSSLVVERCATGAAGSFGRAASLFLILALLGLGALGLGGCESEEGGPGRFQAHGVVEDVDLEGGQVLIDHEDVEGLMPAMTMNFVVSDPDVLSKLETGQVIDFEIHFTGRSYDVSAVEVVGEAPIEEGWRRLREGLVRSSEAPTFELTNQAGELVSLESLGDRVLLVDFIYTSCPGPCPIQTSNQVALQRSLPEAIRDAVHFVSISLDPTVDRPEVLEAYATARGADLSTWSFLTGPEEVVAEVVRRWGVGSLRKDDGTIDHTLLTFLVKDGRVFERYSPRDAGDPKILAGIVDLVGRRDAPGEGAGVGAREAEAS